MIIFDLHIHSRYSRATSKDLNLDNLSHWAKIKGINILGTGDFTHPVWLEEIKNNLKELKEGIYEYKGVEYMLQAEINNVFEYENKTRKVHNLLIAKSFEEVYKINEILSKHGDLKEDGRPTIMLSCEEMMAMFNEAGLLKDVVVVPAHAWTPWFGIYGSKSGFNSIRECFGKYHKHVFAIETGLSSDPEMNGFVEETRNLSLISNSDAHSYWPWRLGREANIYKGEDYDYDKIMDAIKKKDIETIEVDPSYGKYHYDGHRKCGICIPPEEAKKFNNLCPVCGKKLTLGVLHRVYDLADELGKKHEQKFYRLLPLHEVIALRFSLSVNSKKVWSAYYNLIEKYGNEYNVLLFKDIALEDKRLEELIIKNREGKIKVKPGCDGLYGTPIMENENQNDRKNNQAKQRSIWDFKG